MVTIERIAASWGQRAKNRLPVPVGKCRRETNQEAVSTRLLRRIKTKCALGTSRKVTWSGFVGDIKTPIVQINHNHACYFLWFDETGILREYSDLPLWSKTATFQIFLQRCRFTKAICA